MEIEAVAVMGVEGGLEFPTLLSNTCMRLSAKYLRYSPAVDMHTLICQVLEILSSCGSENLC